ncbi:MAG: F0F1 ATP synthase subunit A [Clostridia bacterium]|nr:F0F1 ATP synthase subunit A [Clostridia bacterium]
MDLQVSGPKVFFVLPWDLPDTTIFTMKNLITQTTITLFVTTIILIILAVTLTRKITKRPGKVQVLLEKVVGMLYNLVESTMGKHNIRFAPYIGTLFVSSIFGSVIGMTQLFRSSTADLSVTMAWALVTTGMVWYNNIKNFGLKAWLKGFTEPIFVMTPMNIVSEIASPLSLAFRHFGNVAGGSVLTALIYGALSLLTSALLGWLPGLLGEIPFFQAGIPAVLSIYFDLFSGFVQALVFSLLTMVYVSGACPPPEELPEDRRAILEKREAKKAKKAKN